MAHDLALRAKGKGWTIAQAQAEYRVGEALDVVTSALAAQRPDVFVTAKRSTNPGGTPSLYIKGPADQVVVGLVDASTIKIDIVDNQPYSFMELLERRDRVVRALLAIDGVPNNNLVRMDGKTSTFGDSGGGWSVGSVAYGTQKGWCINQTYDTYSVAALFSQALGVTVKTN